MRSNSMEPDGVRNRREIKDWRSGAPRGLAAPPGRRTGLVAGRSDECSKHHAQAVGCTHLSFAAVIRQTAQMEKYASVRKLIGLRAKNFTEAQLEEADDRLRQYVALAVRVFERLEHDPEAMVRFEALTVSRCDSRMNGKGQEDNP
jgi:hypothetical protein